MCGSRGDGGQLLEGGFIVFEWIMNIGIVAIMSGICGKFLATVADSQNSFEQEIKTIGDIYTKQVKGLQTSSPDLYDLWGMTSTKSIADLPLPITGKPVFHWPRIVGQGVVRPTKSVFRPCRFPGYRRYHV